MYSESCYQEVKMYLYIDLFSTKIELFSDENLSDTMFFYHKCRKFHSFCHQLCYMKL